MSFHKENVRPAQGRRNPILDFSFPGRKFDICSFLSQSLKEIKKAIAASIEIGTKQAVEEGSLSQKESDTAQALYQSRYSQSEWNLGTPAR